MAIYDANGEEVVRWVDTEWNEDPSLATTIAIAVGFALTDPAELIMILGGQDE